MRKMVIASGASLANLLLTKLLALVYGNGREKIVRGIFFRGSLSYLLS